MNYYEIDEMLRLRGFTCPCSGVNNNGENLIFERGRDSEGEWIEVQTFQHNNWVRINRFYKSGVVTEEYDK